MFPASNIAPITPQSPNIHKNKKLPVIDNVFAYDEDFAENYFYLREKNPTKNPKWKFWPRQKNQD